MANKCKQSPKINCAAFKKKAQEVWESLNKDNIEVTMTTSAIGLLLFALGVGISFGISRCITKMELKSALRKQKQLFLETIDDCEKNLESTGFEVFYYDSAIHPMRFRALITSEGISSLLPFSNTRRLYTSVCPG